MINRDEIQYRVGASGDSSKGKWAMALVYIDARTAQRELDEKFGDDWEFTWATVGGHLYAVKGSLKCNGKIREDVGYPQELKMKGDANDSEALKDAVSDAEKRCAVQFGIGRFLYDAPKLYTYGVKTNKTGKVIGFTEEGEQEIESKIDAWYREIKTKLSK